LAFFGDFVNRLLVRGLWWIDFCWLSGFGSGRCRFVYFLLSVVLGKPCIPFLFL
jgi:hypothetical protein